MLESLKAFLTEIQGGTSFNEDQAVTKLKELLGGKGFTVRSTAEDQTYLEANSQRLIDDAFSKRNGQMEQTIAEKTGVPKTANEKYYEYFTRAMGEVMNKLQQTQAKVTEYENKGVSGNVMAEEYKKQVDALQAQIKTLQDEHKNNIKELNEKMFLTKFDNEISMEVDKLRAKFKNLDPALAEDVIANRIRKFKDQYDAKDLNGTTIFSERKTGQPALSKQDGKHKNLSEILSSETFADLISAEQDDPGNKGTGAGSGAGKGDKGGGSGNPNPGDPAWKALKRPDMVKSKSGLLDWLKTQKIDEGTKDHAAAFAHFSKLEDGKELPLRDPAPAPAQ